MPQSIIMHISRITIRRQALSKRVSMHKIILHSIMVYFRSDEIKIKENPLLHNKASNTKETASTQDAEKQRLLNIEGAKLKRSQED